MHLVKMIDRSLFYSSGLLKSLEIEKIIHCNIHQIHPCEDLTEYFIFGDLDLIYKVIRVS